MGLFGFIIGTLLAQVAGAAAYRFAKRRALNETLAAIAGGFVAAVAATPVYIAFHIQDWLAGSGSSWGVSAFMAVCMGIVQGVLFRGRPLGRGP